ncbi:Alpha/beta hydrolase fold-1 [Lentinula detonsa]|uniref:Alpha/beta hydrolase fold-1 n=1 Tax=Lentinula detonsa TaxID=2804962 RepID=A0A9W8NRV1_9AGAR|nr:Alpha/beta hydrolase fold-1 [Lentinula detonsa]KAJ3984226.1 Alpha/beta hydrolase fold-1 [Lentinula detonsa]
MTAKRYTLGFSGDNTFGLTLLFAHGVGSHKEQWEPTIERIFLTQAAKDRHQQIREAWSFDWQNHGDTALVNEKALKDRPEGVSIYVWASAITDFVRSPRMAGHRIVPLGHSAGAGAMMLTMRSFPLSRLPYVSLILVEPTMITREMFEAHFDDRIRSMEMLVGATEVRRDVWPDREEAFRWLSRRFPFRTWDPRVVRLLVEYGLYQKSPESKAVTLKCDRKQEAISYPDVDGHFEATTELARVCHTLPVHVIWGTSNDMFPGYFQESLNDATQGRIVASASRVHGAGHLVMQEKPDHLALKICEALDTISSYLSLRSRL